MTSRSVNAVCGLMMGGGASIVPFFACFSGFLAPAEKNEAKKLCSSFLGSTSRSLLLLTASRWFLGSLD